MGVNARRSGSGRYLMGVAFSVALAGQMQAAAPVVILIGPPSAGKTTQAQILKKDLGMALISADDLIAKNPELLQRFKNPSLQGVDPRLDPALNMLVEEALQSADLSKGVVLDGYPAAKTQADHRASLKNTLGLPRTIVIHLKVPDDVVRKRAKNENTAEVEQQLKNYHRELDFARSYFPEADIREVDGTRKPDDVAKEIRKLLNN
jgi:adenylate kinase family enzyme